jgi:hypothetical protein
MGAQGTATLDFGVFPGSAVTSVDAVATGVVSTSAIEAWIRPEATADHTDADHVVAPMQVVGTFLSNDNIRIWGINTNDVLPPAESLISLGQNSKTAPSDRQPSPMFVGQFKVNWVWN